jgi:hypothetical protein
MTMLLSLVAVPTNTLFGVQAALALARNKDFPGRTFLISLLDLPFSISPVITGACWVGNAETTDRTGTVVRVLGGKAASAGCWLRRRPAGRTGGHTPAPGLVGVGAAEVHVCKRQSGVAAGPGGMNSVPVL